MIMPGMRLAVPMTHQVDNTTNEEVVRILAEDLLCMKGLLKLVGPSHSHQKLVSLQLDMVKVAWAMRHAHLSLTALGPDADSICAADINRKHLMAVEKARLDVDTTAALLESYITSFAPTEELPGLEVGSEVSVKDLDLDTAFFKLGAEGLAKGHYSSEMFDDVVAFLCSKTMQSLEAGMENLQELGAAGFEATSWKKDLSPDSSTEDVLTASSTIAKGGAKNLREQLEKFSKDCERDCENRRIVT